MSGIIRWDPFKEIERFFEEQFLLPTFTTFSVTPVDIYETAKELVVEIGLPGVKKEDLKLKVEEERIILESKKEEKEEVKEENYYRKEIRRGEFKKVISLPYRVDPSTAKAEMKNGVLKIIFNKESKEKGKELVIE